MSNEGSSSDPYSAVVADLQAQIVRLQEAIETIKAVQGGSPVPTSASGTGTIPKAKAPQDSPLLIAVDEFHQMTVGAAIKKFLDMRKRKPATTQEIIEALIQGGQAGSEGSNFNVVVNNTLNRLQGADGSISKVKRGLWGLREWYAAKASD